MGSKMVINRQKSSEAVQAVGRNHADEIEKGVTAAYGPDAGPAVKLLIHNAVEILKRDTVSMVSSDDEHLKETADDASSIDERDTFAQKAYEQLVDFRETAKAVYGSEYVDTLGFKGSTPQDPVAIHRLGVLVTGNISSSRPPEPRRAGVSLDIAQWSGPLGESIRALEKSLSHVADEKREAESLLVARNTAIEKYDRTFSKTADLMSSLLSIAGKDELAQRVRPSRRRSGQTAEVANDAKE